MCIHTLPVTVLCNCANICNSCDHKAQSVASSALCTRMIDVTRASAFSSRTSVEVFRSLAHCPLQVSRILTIMITTTTTTTIRALWPFSPSLSGCLAVCPPTTPINHPRHVCITASYHGPLLPYPIPRSLLLAIPDRVSRSSEVPPNAPNRVASSPTPSSLQRYQIPV